MFTQQGTGEMGNGKSRAAEEEFTESHRGCHHKGMLGNVSLEAQADF